MTLYFMLCNDFENFDKNEKNEKRKVDEKNPFSIMHFVVLISSQISNRIVEIIEINSWKPSRKVVSYYFSASFPKCNFNTSQ